MQAYDIYADLKHTNNILMELPCFRQMLDENYALSERADSLKIALEYLESKNRRLSKKVAKYKRMYKNAKKSKATVSKNIGAVIDLVSDDDEVVVKDEVVEEPVVVVKKEVIVEKPVAVVKKEVVVAEKPVEPIVMTIEEDTEEEVVEEVVDNQEEEEEDTEEEEAEEEVVDDQEEEAEEEEAEEEEAEEVVDDQEEEAEEEEEEEEAEEEEEEEEAEVYETVIKGKTYYIQNEKDGPIYEADENGEISLEVGVYKNGKPTFF